MRTALTGPVLVVAAGFALVGCSSSSDSVTSSSTSAATGVSVSPTTLPAVPEAFTLLPCPKKPESTIGIEGCSEHRIVTLDHQVEAAARAVAKNLQSVSARRNLVSAQDAWILYRKAACASESDIYAGGSLAPVEYASCEVRLDKARLADFAAISGATSP